jgi:ankyrin repeat protein
MGFRFKRSTLVAGFIGMVVSATMILPLPNDTQVADAAMKGDLDAVRTLLKQGADVNAPQGDGMTALHWAAYKDSPEMLQALLYAGANPGAALRINGMTPLFFAGQNGNPTTVDMLLRGGADVNVSLKNGATALMYAARAGNAAAVTRLLEAGAAVNARENARGETALMFAAASNRAGAVQTLLAHGADPAVTTRVIDVAARNAARGRGQDPAPAAVAAPGQAPPGQGQRGIRGGGNGNEERPPEVDTMGGMTALLFAARQGHAETVKTLIAGGADINGSNSGDKTTPLLIASINGHFDLATMLLEAGADPTLASTAAATPLYAVINVKWPLIAEYPQPDTRNEKTSYLDLMRQMLDRGANPNVRIRNELWYTGYASSRTQIDASGATPLWRASQASDVAAMRLLIERGADRNIRNNRGQSPLHIAAGADVHGNQERTVYGTWMPGVKYLVEELHMDVNDRDGKGLTPLHHAAGRGDNDMILYLVSKGADVTAVGKNGETVVDLANGPRQRIQPFAETIALLEMLGARNSHKCVSC